MCQATIAAAAAAATAAATAASAATAATAASAASADAAAGVGGRRGGRAMYEGIERKQEGRVAFAIVVRRCASRGIHSSSIHSRGR